MDSKDKGTILEIVGISTFIQIFINLKKEKSYVIERLTFFTAYGYCRNKIFQYTVTLFLEYDS